MYICIQNVQYVRSMIRSSRILMVTAALLAIISDVAAQSRSQARVAQIDSVLAARYSHTPYDTNYVIRPEGKLTLRLRLNQTGNDFHAKGTINGINSKTDLSTSHKTTVSIGASYLGVSGALAINPSKIFGHYKDYELNFNYYSSKFSLDFSYQRSESLAGDIDRSDGGQQLESGDIKLKVVNMSGYYTFNHRRFSYPAVFTQSYIQRKSAGSWLVGISYQGGSIETTEALKLKNPNAPDTRIYIGQVGIGGGYGYNWVIGRKWLIHFSMLPTFVVYNRNNFTVNGERKQAERIRHNMIFNERAAIVYNFSPRYFAGSTLVMSNSLFDDDAVVVNQNKWRIRAFFGFRL